MHARLICPRCGAALAPAWTGLRCPRLTACGRGGLVEASSRHPHAGLAVGGSGASA